MLKLGEHEEVVRAEGLQGLFGSVCDAMKGRPRLQQGVIAHVYPFLRISTIVNHALFCPLPLLPHRGPGPRRFELVYSSYIDHRFKQQRCNTALPDRV